MGNGMNKILPGLYVGNFRDAKDEKQLNENNITHIVSIHDNAKKILEDKEYLCILASDSPEQDLSRFFPQVNKFIHEARLDGGNVLVHCLAGVSRSVTVTAAYIMTVTQLGWRDSLNAIRGARSVANPNFGFQKQLQNYEHEHVEQERKKFWSKFPESPYNDEEECRYNLRCFQHYIMTGSLPKRSDDLYPLPYKAYQGHSRREAMKTKVKEQVDAFESLSFYPSMGNDSRDDVDELRHDAHQHHHHHHYHHHHHHHHHHHRQNHTSHHHGQNAVTHEECLPESGSRHSESACASSGDANPKEEVKDDTDDNKNELRSLEAALQDTDLNQPSTSSDIDDNGNQQVDESASKEKRKGLVLDDN